MLYASTQDIGDRHRTPNCSKRPGVDGPELYKVEHSEDEESFRGIFHFADHKRAEISCADIESKTSSRRQSYRD